MGVCGRAYGFFAVQWGLPCFFCVFHRGFPWRFSAEVFRGYAYARIMVSNKKLQGMFPRSFSVAYARGRVMPLVGQILPIPIAKALWQGGNARPLCNGLRQAFGLAKAMRPKANRPKKPNGLPCAKGYSEAANPFLEKPIGQRFLARGKFHCANIMPFLRALLNWRALCYSFCDNWRTKHDGARKRGCWRCRRGNPEQPAKATNADGGNGQGQARPGVGASTLDGV